MMKVSWSVLKSFVDSRSLSIQWIDIEGAYWMKAFDGRFEMSCVLSKEDPANVDLIAFEASYKAAGNTKIAPTVSGLPIIRPASTRPGWRYCPRFITFQTAVYNSLHNKKADVTTDIGDVTMKFWQEDWTPILRSSYASDGLYQTLGLDVLCKITTVDWEATYDQDIKGAVFLNGARPAAETWAYIVAAPDIPAVAGGSIPFTDGGIPLHLMTDYSFIASDAGTVKSVSYDSTYHTGKFRLIIHHPTLLTKIKMGIGFQHYKA